MVYPYPLIKLGLLYQVLRARNMEEKQGVGMVLPLGSPYNRRRN